MICIINLNTRNINFGRIVHKKLSYNENTESKRSVFGVYNLTRIEYEM